MPLLYYVIFGIVVGAIANLIDSRPAQGGILGAMVLGILGSVIGGLIGDAIFGVGISGFNITSILLGILGSAILLYVGRMINRQAVQ